MPIGELFALVAAAGWAVGSLLFAHIGRRASPGAMNLGKCLAASVVLTIARAAFSPSLGPVAWSRESATLLAASGVVGLTIGDTAYFGAIVSLGVPRAILLLSAAPVFAAIGGRVLLAERIGLIEASGIALTLSGIALVVTGRRPSPSDMPAPSEPARDVAGARPVAARVRRGIALGLVAAVCQASGSLLSRRAMSLGVDPLGAAATRLVAGAAGLVVVAVVTRHARPWLGELRANRVWLRVAGASLIGTVGGIWLSQLAIALCTSTGVATTLLATSPIFALPLAHFIGHERVTPRGVAGTLIAIGGVVILSLRPTGG